MKTKGEVEAEISEAMVQFEVEYMGRGPRSYAPTARRS
ncbi:MAG TPA: Na-translocating system protein MpsC family protein [Candidatus Binatia bacterium]